MSDLFSGLNEAKEFERGTWLEEGTYKGEITKCILKTDTFKGKPCFIINFVVTESSNPKHPVGSARSHVQTLVPAAENLPKLKTLIYALAGADTPAEKEDMDCEAFARAASGPEQVFAGNSFRVEVLPYVKKDKTLTTITRFAVDRASA